MPLEKKPFVSYSSEEEIADRKKKEHVVSLRMNKDEMELLKEVKQILQQPKDSTAFKQMFMLGYFALHDTLAGKAGQYLFKNKRNNARVGIYEVE